MVPLHLSPVHLFKSVGDTYPLLSSPNELPKKLFPQSKFKNLKKLKKNLGKRSIRFSLLFVLFLNLEIPLLSETLSITSRLEYFSSFPPDLFIWFSHPLSPFSLFFQITVFYCIYSVKIENGSTQILSLAE